ncbi:MAG: DUF4097 family beta strand repeat protein, partial [Gammaproteobacteria bacterium]|nr:DUF4097 family beta strand repeat protein [Gammaproteobacteria bacterium]
VVRNLVGEVRVLPAQSNELRIESTIVAADKADLNKIEIIQLEESGQIEIRTRYPVEDYSYFYYAPDYRNSTTNTSVRYQGEKVGVGSKRRNKNAIDIHVDYVIYLPRRAELKVALAAGKIDARDVDADLGLDTKSGAIGITNTQGVAILDTGSGQLTASAHVGRLSLDTGSGDITASSVTGDVYADTGSGGIELQDIVGNITADTGSGDITITQANGKVSADTGSGSIELEGTTGSVNADTGSGSIKLVDWRGGEQLLVDTGSGSVRVDGDLGQVERLDIETGSGSVRVFTSTVPSVRLDISSRTGIDVDMPQLSEVKKSRGRYRARIGEGAGVASIETGSGSVTFKLK